MDALQPFLNALPTAATSPYAYAAYVLLLGSWLVSLWLGGRPQRQTQKILATFRDDAARNTALARLLGESPPRGLPKEQILQWAQSQTGAKSKTYLLIGYVATLVTVIIIGVVALTLANSAVRKSEPPFAFQSVAGFRARTDDGSLLWVVHGGTTATSKVPIDIGWYLRVVNHQALPS
jgi:hypothetical protein